MDRSSLNDARIDHGAVQSGPTVGVMTGERCCALGRHTGSMRLTSLVVGALAAVISASGAAVANGAGVSLADPPTIGRTASRSISEATAQPMDLRVALSVQYRDGALWNAATRKNDPVRLRSYLAGESTPSSLVGPTIEARPGDTLRLHLTNDLPADDPSCAHAHHGQAHDLNIPHCFNSTNMHAHGIWVSPTGNSDNVFLRFDPGTSFEHEYAIPADHPAGTFWYHPHLHGSTALQVSSGMAGALILRGDRMPSADRPGDLDVLLRPTKTQPFRERVILFQQFAYGCEDENRQIKTDISGRWICDDGDVGVIEQYLSTSGPNTFGGGVWNASGRHTAINGLVLPVLKGVTAGQFERWRLIHAGVRDTVNLTVVPLDETSFSSNAVETMDTETLTAACRGPSVPLNLVAADGLTMNRVRARKNAVMQPGYRWDALLAFPSAGRYCLLDVQDPIGGGMDNQTPHDTELLALVEVDAGGGVAETADDGALAAALIDAARQNITGDMAARVVNDLENGLSLAAFAAHRSLMGTEPQRTRHVVYNIDITTNPVRYEINGKPFDPTDVWSLELGAVEDWVLSSTWEGHPHHVHVNPFQIVAVLDPDGKDVSMPGSVDDFTGEVDTQFAGLKGVWKDTIWVKNPKKSPEGAYTIRVRTKYRRYIGRFVLHCHILDHEDQGMMQIVEIVLP